MQTTGRPLSHGLAGVPRDEVEARAFLQRRIRMVAGIVAFLSLAFLAVSFAATRAAGIPRTRIIGAIETAHLAATAAPLLVWLACRMRPWTLGTLAFFDATSTIAAGIGFAWMGYVAGDVTVGVYPTLLAVTNICFARAVIVPSTTTRTLWIHGAAYLACLVSRWYGSSTHPDRAFFLVETALWSAIALVVTGVASRVLYGLRERVRATMQLGQYTLDDKIGEGGMGVVYRANHAMLRRPTAIKLLPAEMAGEHNLHRFEREVQITSRLTHPNTVAIYDFGRTPDGVFYYAMEFLDGVTLEQLVALRGPQPAARVVHFLRQIVGALAEAHEAGLIHRDIKPANVIVCERGGIDDVIKVLDFGLVKELKPETGAPAQVTRANTLMGTPLYMAPEAIVAPDTVSPASDLYAVGAIGYFLLTGKTAFAGTTLVQALANQLHGELVTPSERLKSPILPELEAVVMKCLEREPAERPTSARHLETTLEKIALAHPWTQEAARALGPLRNASAPPPAATSETSIAMRATLEVDLRERGVEIDEAS